MNAKAQKKKYHDIKKLFGKEYFKSDFIEPKAHISLSPSLNRFLSDTKKKEIISTKNSSNNLSSKLNRDSRIIKISKNKSNTNYFKLVRDDTTNLKKTKILIKSLINKSNNNLRKTNEYNSYHHYMFISDRKNENEIEKKKNYENSINNSNANNSYYPNNKMVTNIKKKQTDINLKKIKSNKNNINKLILCDSLFKNVRENQNKRKNIKNKVSIKDNKNRNIFKLKELNSNRCSGFYQNNKNNYNNDLIINNKNYLKTIETNMLIKKIKINNTLNNKNINKNKSYESLYKQNFPTSKNKKYSGFLKKNVKYILFNSQNKSSSINSQILYSQIFSKNNHKSMGNIDKNNKKINKSINKNRKNSGINNYCFKNKSIDINNNNDSFKNKFLLVLNEQRKKLREEELKKNMKEIYINSNLRKQKYIKLFKVINQSFSDIKKLIEQIEKEDLLKDITSKINDDVSYESILNKDNSNSIEQQFKSILNNRFFNNKNENTSYKENTTSIIYNDFTFEEDKKDISLKSIDIKKNSFFETNEISEKEKINENKDICDIF